MSNPCWMMLQTAQVESVQHLALPLIPSVHLSPVPWKRLTVLPG
jgi:hypothetical protein